MLVKIKDNLETRKIYNDEIINQNHYVYAIIVTTKDKFYLCDVNDWAYSYLLLKENSVFISNDDNSLPTFWVHERYDKYHVIKNPGMSNIKLKEYYGPKEFIEDDTFLSDIFTGEDRVETILKKFFNPKLLLKFEIKNTYDNLLYKILKKFNNNDYRWIINEEEVYKEGTISLFDKKNYTNDEFFKLIKDNVYYIIFLKLELYKDNKLLIELKIIDSIYVDIILHDREMYCLLINRFEKQKRAMELIGYNKLYKKMKDNLRGKVSLLEDGIIWNLSDKVEVRVYQYQHYSEGTVLVFLKLDNEKIHVDHFHLEDNKIYDVLKWINDDALIVKSKKLFGKSLFLLIDKNDYEKYNNKMKSKYTVLYKWSE